MRLLDLVRRSGIGMAACALSAVFALAPIFPGTAFAATLDIVNGALTFTDGGTESNSLTVSVGNNIYSFSDSVTKISLGAGAIASGWRGNGTNAVSGSASPVSSITISAGGGTNTVNLRSIASGDDTTVNGGDGTTAVTISSTAPLTGGSLSGIAAAVTVNAGAVTSLAIGDTTGATRPNPVVIGASGITGLAVNPISYTGTFTSLRVSGSNSSSLSESYELATPPTNSFRLDTNGGPDTVTVSEDTTGDVYLGAGDDTLTVLAGVTLSGNVSGGAGTNTYFYGPPDYGTVTGTVN